MELPWASLDLRKGLVKIYIFEGRVWNIEIKYFLLFQKGKGHDRLLGKLCLSA